MNRFKSALDRSLAAGLSTAMGLAVLTVLWQVISRYLLAAPSSFTDELVRYLLVWIGLLGGAQAAGQRLHLAIDLLPRKLTPGNRHRLAAGVQLLIAAFALTVLVAGGGSLVRLTLELGQRSAALGIPLGWVYVVLPLSGLITTFYALFFMRESWQMSKNKRAGT